MPAVTDKSRVIRYIDQVKSKVVNGKIGHKWLLSTVGQVSLN